ncbi:peroxisomal N(1)-acetyl-spermine/spermidine oxidase-like protein [Euroglyphus maynei]|uniref:Peroxisomal N(1)-acetyl-spermine/spermidine oxidase-like protein n=1 Tax=Euroglyphus maynei TaxID=6958 RepID=A0A1Y3BPD2_EURMA|nr:peroxisomal N(1)-acetyl-spermine/spermidine oxidase-like protein [Euroglyphus maynei]
MAKKPRIAIIGAGIAGIYAARTLYQNGFDNVIIFEASDRIGGRIWSMKHGDDWIELGAQWIHGQEENILYEYACSRGLIANPKHDYGVEGNGHLCNENGEAIECPLAKKLINYLDETKNRMNDAIENDQNVFDYFVYQFNQFVQSLTDIIDITTLKILKNTFRWFIIYEVIDNSCENLQTLSALSYTEWEDCSGETDLIHFQKNYSTIFDEFEKDFPLNDCLLLETEVKKIELIHNNSDIQVKLHIFRDEIEDEEMLFDHIIITSSIGFLKENLKNDFFSFDFPEEKRQIIQAIGFGTINKVFLEFDIPFWNDQVKGFQIVWTNVRDEHSFPDINFACGTENFPEWVYCIQGFDLVRHQPKMLMAWIGSYGAKQMEKYSDQEIGQILTKVLRQIVPKQCLKKSIDYPTNIFCSRWYSNPFFRGSYSNRTTVYQKINNDDDHDGYNIDILVKPIYANDEHKKPLILFAGEATDPKHYSTTHGAMKSGEREAFRLICFHQKR